VPEERRGRVRPVHGQATCLLFGTILDVPGWNRFVMGRFCLSETELYYYVYLGITVIAAILAVGAVLQVRKT